jgi:hypothetical protein
VLSKDSFEVARRRCNVDSTVALSEDRSHSRGVVRGSKPVDGDVTAV